ncbi:MAG: hypothetical protein JXR13_02315 [Thalassovita sp.]
MTERMEQDLELEALFDTAAQAKPAEPSADFMQRVLDDALAEQLRQATALAPDPVQTGPSRGIWASLVGAIGGWPAVAGLATAGVAGLWIGVNPPTALSETAEAYLNISTDLYLVDAMPQLQFDVSEG